MYLDGEKIKNIFAALIGGLAQLARALPWHGRGHRFESDILHNVLNWRMIL